MAVAAHPEDAASITKALDDAREQAEAELDPEGIPEWAKPIDDTEVVDYQSPAEYAEDVIASLREFGVYVKEVPDR